MPALSWLWRCTKTIVCDAAPVSSTIRSRTLPCGVSTVMSFLLEIVSPIAANSSVGSKLTSEERAGKEM